MRENLSSEIDSNNIGSKQPLISKQSTNRNNFFGSLGFLNQTNELDVEEHGGIVINETVSSDVEPKEKTLLENYWYNALMTVFQDLPQTIAIVVIMAEDNLKDDPDNPTGVSLPGYLNLIPQFGNSAAGLAAAHEALRLLKVYEENPSKKNAIDTLLYAIFSLSTMVNGLTNIIMILSGQHTKYSDWISTISTFIALGANFLILCKEESLLLNKLCTQNGPVDKEAMFHLACSVNLNVSIITSILANSGAVNHSVGAYGYLYGTWCGQVPELIEPTREHMNSIMRV